jgi:hypothetical protein
MINQFQALCEELTKVLQSAYEEGVTIEQAERLAARFLQAQIVASQELSAIDLDARMRKSGTKAIKAAVYMEHATKTEKKPSDTYLQALVDMDKLVLSEQRGLDEAEVLRDQIQNYLNIFKDGHIYMRGVAKGRFE